jgi:hypothetical protein
MPAAHDVCPTKGLDTLTLADKVLPRLWVAMATLRVRCTTLHGLGH